MKSVAKYNLAPSLAKMEALRTDVFAQIAKMLAEDGHCKSYEGGLRFEVTWPNYFEAREGAGLIFGVYFDCYLIPPSGRHNSWFGKTPEEAMDKADDTIRRWMKDYDNCEEE